MASPETPRVCGDYAEEQSVSSPSPSSQLTSSASHTSPAQGSSNDPLRTPERSQPQIGNTPGSTQRGCSSDKDAFRIIKVHTAKCSECDLRNMDTMLRCPGCTFQVCRPCRDKRNWKGKGLVHGVMASPGGLYRTGGRLGRSGGLGSGGGSVTRKRLPGLHGSMSPSPAPAFNLAQQAMTPVGDVGGEEEGANKEPESEDKVEDQRVSILCSEAKPASKKRTAKPRPKPIFDEDSSGDDFRPNATSPTPSKRRRTALNLTDTPTATSARPSRKVSGPNAYITPSSPSSDSTLDADPGSVHQVPSQRTEPPKVVDKNKKEGPAAPNDRIQELLEQHGVNTPENPYHEHFLGRRVPVVANPVIKIPPGMGNKEKAEK